ncbi:hypothetical protein AKO1_007868 [Acrasis kona]|uniref:Uncharacterized protein n=1 Tax=Acrasis kona TaxID=1008807 RepID=A0AAW2YPX8_9EUKA
MSRRRTFLFFLTGCTTVAMMLFYLFMMTSLIVSRPSSTSSNLIHKESPLELEHNVIAVTLDNKKSKKVHTNTKKKKTFNEVAAKTKRETIFVSIASYRDAHCPQTLFDLVKNAEFIDRIYVGIVQQNAIVDPDCVSISNIDNMSDTTDLERFVSFRKHIKVLRVLDTQAKGPVWAREKITSQLYDGQDFVFQIDSHSKFVPNWDTILINNYKQLPKKSVITHYPSDYDHKRNAFPKNWETDVARICTGFYNDDKILQPKAAVENNEKHDPLNKSLFIAAGMAFYPGEAHKVVPLDPHLPHLFHGEELSFSIRMIAHGYRFYSPAHNVVFHYYYRKKFPKFWDTAEKDPNYKRDNRRSIQRVRYMLGLIKKNKVEEPEKTLIEMDKYGINWNDPEQDANVKQYYKEFQIDMSKKKVGDFCV